MFLSENFYGVNKTWIRNLGYTIDVTFQGLQGQMPLLRIRLHGTKKVNPDDLRIRASDESDQNVLQNFLKISLLQMKTRWFPNSASCE